MLPSGKVESIKISKSGKCIVKFNYKREIIQCKNEVGFNFSDL